MENQLLNEILTTSVGFLFEAPTSKSPLKSNPKLYVYLNDIVEKNNQKVKINAKNEPIKEIEPRKNSMDLLDCWVINEGPKQYQESMKKIKIDLNKMSRKEMEKMSYEKLNIEKKKIKIELKNYDLVFKATFKRFPLKIEKEPMRPLYIYYKTVKELLMKLTQGLKKMPEDKTKKESITNNNTKLNEIVKKLNDLKKKRDELRAKFQKFHSEFWKNNNRKIKYAQDIAPIEEDYKVYKTIKEQIVVLEAEIAEK